MKLNKILALGAVAMTGATAAQAQTIIYLDGSTAFRNATVIAIRNLNWNGDLKYGWSGGVAGDTGFTKASQQLFVGTLKTPTTTNLTIISCAWSGSASGVQTVAQHIQATAPVSPGFLPNSQTNSCTAGGNQNLSGSDYTPQPNVCMSDVFQSTTPFNTTTLSDKIVGVVGFKFVAGNDATGANLNMTPQLAQALWGGGIQPLSTWDGNPAHQGNLAVALGRDPDSGTRLTAVSETQIGAFSGVFQFEPLDTLNNLFKDTTTQTLGSITAWPDETINGIFVPSPNGGYSSGGQLANAMGAANQSAVISSSLGQPGVFMTYLGLSDATTAIGKGAHEMTYNGFTYSTQAVQQGQYTFWGYEHLMYRFGGTFPLSSQEKAAADALAKQIHDTDAIQAGVLVGSMAVGRPGDGGLVTEGNPY